MSNQLLRELRELVAALDRRAPHVGRAGEALIASDAAALKTEALRQISDLEGHALPIENHDPAEKRSTAG